MAIVTEVRTMRLDDGGGERERVSAFAKLFRATRDMPYSWTLWKNWERFPPDVVAEGGDILAFHAYSLTKSGYLNSYWIAVSSSRQGKGYGGMLASRMLPKAGAAGVRRIKMKSCPAGKAFWEGFGLKFCGTTPKGEYLLDEDLGEETSLGKWINWNRDRREEHAPIPSKALAAYLKKGVKML